MYVHIQLHQCSHAYTGGSGAGGAYTTQAPGGGLIVNVANDSVGLVIGKQGATIKMLEQQSGARIQIAKDCPAGTNMRPITLTGPGNSVEHAKSLILGKVSGVRAAPCLHDHIVCLFWTGANSC